MDITQITQSGFKWNIRVPKCYQDESVIFHVVACDEYHLEEMASHFYPKTILDIGGHIGTFGVFAKSLWPAAKLIVVEPNIDNITLYRMNAETNDLTDVTFYHGAIGYSRDTCCLVNSPSTTGGNILCDRKKAQEYIQRQYRFYNKINDDQVKVYSVEEVLEGVDVVDLAKWDCEGGEVEALKNLTCPEKFRFMVGEYHIWNEETDYLRPPLFDCIQFWRDVRCKFPHLAFNYKDTPLGNFQAWPKELQ